MKINGKRITEIRKEKGISRAALSHLSGVSIRTLEDWEAGRRNPSDFMSIQKICQVLDITYKEILSNEALEELNAIALYNTEQLQDNGLTETILLNDIENIYENYGMEGILKLLDRFIYHTGAEKSLDIIKEFINEDN